MGVSAASNIQSLQAQSQLQRTSSALEKTFQRLASGLRINSPSDDSAGLAIADELNADARIAAVAIRNSNDGISLATLADGAMEEVGSMLSRMAELAEQSANGVYTNTQRSALQSEWLALGSEIERIAVTTTFNGIKILSSNQDIAIQVGFDSGANSSIIISSALATLTALGLASSGQSSLNFSLLGITTAEAQSASGLALDAVNAAITSLSSTRGRMGAVESRLNVAINFVTVARENLLAAESQVRDADIAQEVANMTRLEVLQQAGAAVLAQANQQPALVLKLLS